MDIAKDVVITADNLTSVKIWIMQEMKRLEVERDDLETEMIEFEIEKDDFEEDRKKHEAEWKSADAALKKREAHIDTEFKTLAYQKSLMERKLAILENGFDELNRDRAEFEREKEAFQMSKATAHAGSAAGEYDDIGLLFHGVDNLLALKKRYRDLLKIYHPDNLAGDNEAVQIINQEYALLRDMY
ncbi:MAG: J domain-containing protein [Lachnospiraceae bacterium]|nr:J domain-containing protein [Lachnospiraceae bacterium]